MAGAPVAAKTLKDANDDRWERYNEAHDAAIDALDAAVTDLNARIFDETNPTRQASLENKRDKLLRKRASIEEEFGAANAGEGRIKAPSATEVAEHKRLATEVANATANNMSTTAVIKTATQVANAFSGLHVG